MKQTKKMFKAAPLPFQGQKRNFVEQFKGVLSEYKDEYQVSVIVDLFGGSGLLSHTAKRMYPQMRVIYNDYDDFHNRLECVQITNNLLKKITKCLVGIPKGERVESSMKYLILSLIRSAEKRKQSVDYITLSSSLLFSGKFVKDYRELERHIFYNNVKQTDYSVEDYTDGLEIVKMDYMDLYKTFKNEKNVLFIVDPPYLSTDTSTYNSNKYWKLKDYLDVLNVLAAGKYIYFTSNKSSIVELCEWFSTNYHIHNPFSDAKVNTFNMTINKSAKYTDMMLYKYYC